MPIRESSGIKRLLERTHQKKGARQLALRGMVFGLCCCLGAGIAQAQEPAPGGVEQEADGLPSELDFLATQLEESNSEASESAALDPRSSDQTAATAPEPEVYSETIPVPSPLEPLPQQPEPPRTAVLEEIIVTGQKRAENLHDVAGSISAISGDEIIKRGLHNIEEVTRSIPNVSMTSENLLALYNIRGMGKPTQGNFDASTTAIVDDVPVPAQYLSFAFLDVDSIEVLRGPQGTLYGKNNTAGVFKVSTGAPSYDFTARLNGTVGSYGTERLQGVINVPLWENVASARLKFVHDKRDGYIENTYRNEDDGSSGRDGLGARFRFDISPSVSFIANFLYQTVDQPKGWGYQAIDCPATLTVLARLKDPEFECTPDLNASRDAPEGQEGDALVSSGVLSWNVEDYEIKAFASYYTFESDIFYDADYSPQSLLTLPLLTKGETVSSEIRLLSPTDLWDGDFSFITGLYVDSARSQIDTGLDLLPLPCVGSLSELAPLLEALRLPIPLLSCNGNTGDPLAVESIRQYQDKKVTELAAFAQGTYKIAEPLDLTVGLRYSRVKTEEISAENRDSCLGLQAPCPLGTAGGIGNRSVSGLQKIDNAMSYKIALRYFANDDLTTYVSAATGFKPGGYALTLLRRDGQTAPDDYEAEESISYEVGAKLQFWGGAGRIHLAAFYSTFDNFQVPLRRLVAIENGNAGQAKTRGVELESVFLLPAGLRASINGSYLKAFYSDYKDAPCPKEGGNPQDTDNNPTTPDVCDLSGRTLANAPKWKASALLDGAWHLFDLPFLITAGGDANWQSKVWFQTDTDPQDTQDAYWMFNARLGVADVEQKWDVTLSVNNASNEYVLQTSNDIPVVGGHWGSLAAPRWVNLSASWRFGD